VKFIDASEQALVLGVYRITTDGSRGESFVFQLVTASDERIAHIQDYRRARRRRSTPRALPDGTNSQNLARGVQKRGSRSEGGVGTDIDSFGVP